MVSLPRAMEWTVLLLVLGGALSSQSLASQVDFQRDVLPLLSDRCLACHGPDSESRKANLRLDDRADVLGQPGHEGVVLPGNLEDSEFIIRITSEFPEELMPPGESNLALTSEEIDLLKRWVLEGAEWEEHWSFVAPEETPLPTVEDTAWPRNEIDHFVLAQLETKGWTPSPEATPAELVRRVFLDLTGLPPTLEELDAFLAAPTEDAYGALVDRLLASPRYGERMAWDWLDAARYADTDGFQSDPTRAMWPWRDWLVHALNSNVPFDQLTIEMLAGDLLPDPSPEQILASGFHRNHMMNGEGGRIAEETRVENVFDRVETTGTTWLGMTVSCARCHDHRYDPLSQVEYYQFYDFFNQTSETGRGGNGRAAPTLSYLPAKERQRLEAILADAARLESERRAPSPELDQAQAEWEADWAAKIALDPSLVQSAEMGPWWRSVLFPPKGGGSPNAFDQAYAPESPHAEAPAAGSAHWSPAPDVVDGKVFPLPANPGATYFYRTVHMPAEREMTLSLGSDDGLRVWVNDEEILTRNVFRAAAPDQERVQVSLREGRNEILIKIVNAGGIGGLYFRGIEETADGLGLELLRALAVPSSEKSGAQRSRLMETFRASHSTAWSKAGVRLAELAQERAAIEAAAQLVMVMDALPTAARRASHVLERGNYDQPTTAVQSNGPAFLPAIAKATGRIGVAAEGDSAEPPSLDRLDLAHWLVEPDHPLTARVTVNRLWQGLFGRGIVATADDFGRQGEAPSHPLLLDWLAREFVDSGWDMKGLHRRIVMSSTYRQSAAAPPSAYAEDPHNVWLARGSRFRLPSWMIRDQALSLAGLLVEQVGGPPVRPYQPDGVWSEATFGMIRYEQGTGSELYRRSLYAFWRRIVQPTFLFDTSSRQTCSVRARLTNTPLHALISLNDPAYVEAARGFATRSWHAAGEGVQERIAWAFRTATARAPEPEELAILVDRWHVAREHFVAHPEDALALLDVGASPYDTRVPPADLAALAVVGSVILNLDEVLSKP